MSAEEIMFNANINQTFDNNRAPNVFITQVGGNPAHGTTTTLVTGNQTPNAATAPGCSEALFARPPHIMDQVWDTLLKINAHIDKLQQAYTTSHAENLANFIKVEKRVKAFENSSVVTL